MANGEKPYKRNAELTHQQEIFCEEVAKGETQTEAYKIAYPKSKQWQKEAVWVQASILAGKPKIQAKINELKEDSQEDVSWTRKRVLANITYMLNENMWSIRRRKQIYDEMIDEKFAELDELLKAKDLDNNQFNKVKKELQEIELESCNTPHNNINAILKAIKVINRMQGYDIVKEPEEENNEEKIEEYKRELTIEELRALAYNKTNKN